jgi:DNA-binding protein
MPRRATKPKSTKKATLKLRRKSKPSQPKVEMAAEEAPQSEIIQTVPVTAEAPPEVIEPVAETAEVVSEEAKPEVAPEEAPAVQPEVLIEKAPVPQPFLPVVDMAKALPATRPPATLPPAPSASEAEQEEPDEASFAEELPPRRDVPPNHMFIGKKPVMGYALSAAMQLTQYEEVVLRARGKAISRAVDVAEVIKHRLGNGQFVTRYIKIDTDVVGEGPEKRNVSTIEIGVGKRT